MAPVILFAAHAVQSHNRAYAEVEDRLRRRAAMLSEHVARVFDTQATVIDLIADQLNRANGEELVASGKMAALLAARLGRDSMVNILLATDSQGIVQASTAPIRGNSVADRDYFRGAMASPDLFVGEPVVGRSSNQPVIVLAGRWHGGVIGISLHIRELRRILAAASDDNDEDEVVALFRGDGTQLVRQPERGPPVRLTRHDPGLMQYIPEAHDGVYQAVPQTGGGQRLYAFYQIGNYPVWVSTGVHLQAIQNRWLRDLVPHAVLTLLAVLVVAGTFLMSRRREREAALAEQRLQQAVTERTAEALDAISARKEALAVAERANRAKSHFLASASHDLRQPIQGVRLFLDVLEGRLEDQFDRHVLSNAVKALEGAESLLSTLLDVSTLEAGIIRVAARALPLHDVLSNLADEFAKQAATHGLSFRFVSSGLWVETDPVLLVRVLRNLLTNAVRYTKTGTVLLGCRRQGAEVRVEVWDTGEGIPDDKLETVFDDFIQIGNPERDRAKGLGLGLAVVRRMAVLLGHRVGVRSQLARGTVFWISLPVVKKPNLSV
ncbi:MAG: hypothetical protein H7Y60_16625 [Rhodospirillaceae bacterium]|nr:hypothetical protein [Rhodospirillales bacterium]